MVLGYRASADQVRKLCDGWWSDAELGGADAATMAEESARGPCPMTIHTEAKINH